MSYLKNQSFQITATIAGLAIGACLGVLFAPEAGKKTRKSLLGSKKRRNDQFSENGQEPWEHHRDVAEHLLGSEEERTDPSVIKVPSAGTTAWKE